MSDTPAKPLITPGRRFTPELEHKLYAALTSSPGPVLVRTYATTNTATTAAYKLARKKGWAFQLGEGERLEFFTRTMPSTHVYGVYAHLVEGE